jgi:acyl dehydratase
MDCMKLLGQGYYWDELKVGDRFRTFGRTITEADIISFINCTGFLEVLFTDAEFRAQSSAIPGRVAPAALVYSIAEGLALLGMAQGTGLAFLNMELDVKGPVLAGDTIHVEIEIVEVRAASKHGRGLVRTHNNIVNQNGETVIVYNPLRLVKGSTSV